MKKRYDDIPETGLTVKEAATHWSTGQGTARNCFKKFVADGTASLGSKWVTYQVRNRGSRVSYRQVDRLVDAIFPNI